MANYSPYHGSTPGGEEYLYERYDSATPTPSPRGPSHYYAQQQKTPQHARPATRAHFRQHSTGAGFSEFSPRPPTASPRYTSDGYYATANVSSSHHSRKQSWTTPSRPKRERRNSYVYVRASTPHGESDEDEVIEVPGGYYVLPAQSHARRSRRHSHHQRHVEEEERERAWFHHGVYVGGYGTDHHHYPQGGNPYQDRDAFYETSTRPRPAAANTTARRSSHSVPQRPATARPSSSHAKKPPPPATPAKATEADAKKHRIPAGYSLKNWDPSEDPILLLGSVFDANSLGKWIYDWTVYHHGPSQPISEVAGEMWLLLIQLAGKVKRAEEIVGRVRRPDNKEVIEDFITAGERLKEKLRKLLKTCEQPMLHASKERKQAKGAAQLGKQSGVEFVETMFGRERELDRTERFMQGVRLFNLRFDANCDAILRNPTA